MPNSTKRVSDSHSARLSILRKRKFHYPCSQEPSTYFQMYQLNSGHAVIYGFIKVDFNIILQSSCVFQRCILYTFNAHNLRDKILPMSLARKKIFVIEYFKSQDLYNTRFVQKVPGTTPWSAACHTHGMGNNL
jgi:hypothetical protein